MRWEKAPDIQEQVKEIVKKLEMNHIYSDRVICFRSFGSRARARARIWALPRVWQQALKVEPHYVVEVLSESFEGLNLDDKTRILIHELLHIPKNFSGSLVQHRGRYHRIDSRVVEKVFKLYKKES